jgi:hypothetical protein
MFPIVTKNQSKSLKIIPIIQCPRFLFNIKLCAIKLTAKASTNIQEKLYSSGAHINIIDEVI